LVLRQPAVDPLFQQPQHAEDKQDEHNEHERYRDKTTRRRAIIAVNDEVPTQARAFVATSALSAAVRWDRL
jgi:hypothetical protein